MLLVVGLQSLSLSEPHRVFLEDVAHFLLTAAQRDRFIALETEALRTSFIESFWTVRNASEHAERLRDCDRLFGSRGRWSQRGRIYQWLGAPSHREDLTRAGHRLVPIELWHYTGVERSFLPDSFYLVFFKPGGAGAFRLWRPDADGIASLVPAAEPNRFSLGPETTLGQIDPELALAAESLVPGGGRREAQSLLTSLEALPELAERAFATNVRVTTSTGKLPSRLVSEVWLDDAGVAELHYALELSSGAASDLRWREEESGRYQARFTLIGRLMSGGLERERWEDALELDVSDAEKHALSRTRLIFQGRRLVQASDERFELALVTDGAGAVVATTLAPVPALQDPSTNASRADSFRSELEGVSAPARVLERSRTPLEEGRYRFTRGLALARRGSTERAIAEMDTAAELSHDDARVHLELARLLYASHRHRDVLSRLSAVEQRFEDEADVFVLMAGAAEALGLYADAVMYYEKARTLAPESEAIGDALERASRAR